MKPLRDMNYDYVVGWLKTLDFLNQSSDYAHTLAARYFGEVNISPERVGKIVFYLRGLALADPVRNWGWMVWAANKTRTLLKDRGTATVLAHDLQSDAFKNPAIPAWVRLLPVQLYRLAGDDAAANEAFRALPDSDKEAIDAERRALEEKLKGSKK